MMHWSMFVMVLTLDSTVKISLHDRKRTILGITDATTPIFSRKVCTYVCSKRIPPMQAKFDTYVAYLL